MRMRLLLSAITAICLTCEMRAQEEGEKTSGQGDWVFKFRPDLSVLPPGADTAMKRAHGGVAVDRQTGDVYYQLGGYGIIHMSPDLTSTRKLIGDAELSKISGHNVSVSYDDTGQPYLLIPDNRRGIIYYADTEGKILSRLERPEILDWFKGSRYNPTDVIIVDGQMLVSDGYGSKFVFPAEPFGKWVKGIYGGRSAFVTNHGISHNPATDQIAVADREGAKIYYFDKKGSPIMNGKSPVVHPLPGGARPCDIEFLPDGISVAGCLRGANNAPGEIYILDPAGQVLSVIKPKLELGLDSGHTHVEHIHHTNWTQVGDTIYLLVYAWNPGGFMVLERVKN